MLERWRVQARALKRQAITLYLAARHPQVPWYAKALAVVVVAYAASPIDLIPDFVPVLGHLDDLLLVPLGVWLVIRLVPPQVWAECRQQATTMSEMPSSRAGIWLVIGLWGIVAIGFIIWLKRII